MDSQQPASNMVNTSPGTPEMRAVLCADLVDSTALVERIGDIPGADLMRRHDRMARDLLQRHGGQEIDKTDGFLLLFGRALDAVAFALAYQRGLAELSREVAQLIQARVGIHLGEVILWQNMASDVAQGAKPTEVEGLAKPVAARLMGLARPAQILLSGAAFNLAQRASGELPESAAGLRWLTHGRYQFKGVPQPQLVHEVGEVGTAPLKAPGSSAKAWRDAPIWRRPMVLAVEAIATLLMLSLGMFLALRSPSVIAFAERDWVVVADLVSDIEDRRFDDSLSTALRIGLEQSRWVNVLSELAARDGLRRMGLEPGAALDRSTASQLALREGARAVVVPFVAEVGGRLRVGVELVDPKRQRVVRTMFEEGEGHASALASLDTIMADLRQTLGESLVEVEASSSALEQVTTPSIAALRAYTLAQRALAGGELGKANALLEQALELDPEFALAHIGEARVRWAQDRIGDAVASMGRALAKPERLTERERLYARAQLATFEWQADFIEQWNALVALYPDFHVGHHNLSILHWSENRFVDMLNSAEAASAQQSVTRPVSLYMKAIAQLGLEQNDAALENFDLALRLGFQGFSVEHAGAFAAQRRFDAAREVLKASPPSAPFLALTRQVASLAISVDEGDWKSAQDLALVLNQKLPAEIGAYRWAVLANALAADRGPERSELRAATVSDAIAGLIQELDSGEPGHPTRQGIALGYFAFLASREGAIESAERAVAAIDASARMSRQNSVANMAAIARARIALAKGDPQRAMQLLESHRNAASLLLGHMVNAEAHSAAGDHLRAAKMFSELAGRRGQAYAEWGADHVLLVENVIQANRAWLRAAEESLAAGDPAGAGASLAKFHLAWPDLEGAPELAGRVLQLETKLATP